IACASEIQAGGNVNYFFEFLLALTPPAAFAMTRIDRYSGTPAGVFLALIVGVFLVWPAAQRALGAIPAGSSAHNREMEALQSALRGRRVRSMDADVALAAPEIVLGDPFGVSQFERIGKLDLRPLAARIRGRGFDLLAVQREAESYRGMPLLSPTLR